MGIPTRKYRILNAANFISNINSANNSFYFFIGRNNSWSDDASPPTESDSVINTDYNVFREAFAAKKVLGSEVSHVVVRNDWTSGTVYTGYTDSNGSLANSAFYVVTDELNVYKCLFNNYGATSTTKPTGTSVNNDIITADSYVWKYLYTISGPDASRFLTTNYMPVKTLAADDGTTQWGVQTNAVSGALHTYRITANGSGYVAVNTGTIANTVNTTQFSIAGAASSNNSFYNNSAIYITGGSGAGQVRRITSYTGATRRVTVDTAFNPAIDATSTYTVSPYVRITGDGSGAAAYTTTTGGAISNIIVVSRGSGYTTATVGIEAGVGSGATAVADIPPFGGHGKNPVEELYAHSVMVNVRLTGNESNTFSTKNEYRTIGLLKDPTFANGTIATGTTYDLATQLGLTSHTGIFQSDEVVTGQTSAATGRVVEFTSNTFMRVSQVQGTFANGESIRGATSNVSATINLVTSPSLARFSGDVIYIENRPPIARADAQSEFIKLVIRF